MLSEAKNTSELMVDLAYAALFYNSEDFSEEVIRLEERLNDLVHDMRTLAILAARSPADAEQMAGILQVVQDIEKIGNAANDIAKIVLKKLGIPPELLQDIPEAEEIPDRVSIHPESTLDGRSLEDVDLPTETGTLTRSPKTFYEPETCYSCKARPKAWTNYEGLREPRSFIISAPRTTNRPAN
jgi:uncharacterized protein with PhoU and TrkA domain